jgi:UDP-galactopyranose mutase
MKILVVGAGLSGCSMARLLKDAGHDVSILEKESHVGGLCMTRVSENGLKYEPFGAHTFHTRHGAVRDFVLRFDQFNGYVHRKGMILNGRLFPFPITLRAIKELPEAARIFQELKERPEEIDRRNFETACVSIFGPTMYRYFIHNYTSKMWGCDPRHLSAEWAPSRLTMGEDGDDRCFKNQWQGLPCHGFSFLLERMIEGIPIQLNTRTFDPARYALVISSAPIDEIMRFKFGRLQYRSLEFYYKRNESWEKRDYGTINLPQHPTAIRKCNFAVLHKAQTDRTLIQYQQPLDYDDQHAPMYPVSNEKNASLFDRYLSELTRTNICPLGRLGLFKYLDMDKAVLHSFEMLPIALDYLSLPPTERYLRIKNLLRRY